MFKPKRVLLLYISILSGHHRAALAVEKALKYFNPDTEVFGINAFNYTNPILEKVINGTYNGIIKRTPEVWEYLYDNPKIVKNSQRLKDMMHRFNSAKMKSLIEDFNPDVIACTQAFPCGMVADYKTSFNKNIPLVGILTDFYPHSYWVYEAVDKYVVASSDAKVKLIENGVSPEKIEVFGIPIDRRFGVKEDHSALFKKLELDPTSKTILVMGGSGGWGPIKKILVLLDRIRADIQTIVVTGTNNKLYNNIQRKAKKLTKKVFVLGYCDYIDKLMSISDIIVTKPGGLTVSESLAKGLPIIIINPIPGQEAKNTEFLLSKKAAIKARNEEELAVLVENLCSMPTKLNAMKEAAAEIGKPEAALNIAKMILEL